MVCENVKESALSSKELAFTRSCGVEQEMLRTPKVVFLLHSEGCGPSKKGLFEERQASQRRFFAGGASSPKEVFDIEDLFERVTKEVFDIVDLFERHRRSL